jgi:hypothetical protein
MTVFYIIHDYNPQDLESLPSSQLTDEISAAIISALKDRYLNGEVISNTKIVRNML